VKYNQEITELVRQMYVEQKLASNVIAKELGAQLGEEIPERSIISKLSALGVYKRKEYVTKQGNPPIRKSEYIEKIAQILGKDLDLLESLEKVNKNVLIMILDALDARIAPVDETDPKLSISSV